MMRSVFLYLLLQYIRVSSSCSFCRLRDMTDPKIMADDPHCCYPEPVDSIRETQYPSLKGNLPLFSWIALPFSLTGRGCHVGTIYLDHAGLTPPSKSLINGFAQSVTSHIYGNPHSFSSAAQLSSDLVDDVRFRILRFVNASPDLFDVVFTSNATAGIRLVIEGLRDYLASRNAGMRYVYHVESHTSAVGAREMTDVANQQHLSTDVEVEEFCESLKQRAAEGDDFGTVFQFPGQSNMSGRRFPMNDWCRLFRQSTERDDNRESFSVVDAASLASTYPLDSGDCECAPDFTVLSFHKIFGFPDLGAVIVRRDLAYVFESRRYFGGGTVDMAILPDNADNTNKSRERYHWKKSSDIHSMLEDGTLPIHDILALKCAFDTHTRLYGSMKQVSDHTFLLASILHKHLSRMSHYNGISVAEIYSPSDYTDSRVQGPIITFNLRTSSGAWIGKSEVEKLAAVKDIQLRTGTLCNPGGMARALNLRPSDMRRHFDMGQRCGDEHDIMDGKPTGGIRVSLGAMSTIHDVGEFLNFIEEFYVEKTDSRAKEGPLRTGMPSNRSGGFYIKQLAVYPIKSCGSHVVPEGVPWPVKPEGLAWDREWCLVHQGTGAALSQKRYPKMALIKPFIDLQRKVLKIGLCEHVLSEHRFRESLEIPLFSEQSNGIMTTFCNNSTKTESRVCGDRVMLQVYSSQTIADFFSRFLDVPCALARIPTQEGITRYSKFTNGGENINPHPNGSALDDSTNLGSHRSILLSNESPMLMISQSSVDHLNATVKAEGKNHDVHVLPDVFRANIIVAEHSDEKQRHPYEEDSWAKIRIFRQEDSRRSDAVFLDVLGSCRRCQMICIDQSTGERGQEPLASLMKTRRSDGKGVYFGRHVGLSISAQAGNALAQRDGMLTLRVGDVCDCEKSSPESS